MLGSKILFPGFYACIWNDTKPQVASCLQSRADPEEQVQIPEAQNRGKQKEAKCNVIQCDFSFQGLHQYPLRCCYSSISKVFCKSLEKGLGALGWDLDSRAAHLASKRSASWASAGRLDCCRLSIGQLLVPPFPLVVVPFCVTLLEATLVVEAGEFCPSPWEAGWLLNVALVKPPARPGNVEEPPPSVPVLGPIPTPIVPPPVEPVALQKTFATICEGVMPTTGTLALGYVMLLATAGM